MNTLKHLVIATLFFCGVATADTTTTTLPNDNGMVSILSGNDSTHLFHLNTDPNAQQYNICDDCVTGPINLGFDFHYFDHVFNQAWMYSNGVLGFQAPTGQGFCCSGEHLSSSLSSDYNYKIFPLWTDLIGGNNTFYSLQTDEGRIFGWYNINEYGTQNKSSFEVALKNDDTFKIIYGHVDVKPHTITMGFTGNASAGEYYQYYHGQGSSQPASNTTVFYQPHVDPCIDNPLYSTTCSGYEQAYLQFQCSTNALYSTSCEGYAEAYAQQLALQNVESQQTTTAIESTSSAATQTSQTTITATEPVTSPGMVGDSTSTFQEVRTDVGGASVSSTGTVVVETGVPDAVRETSPAQSTQTTNTATQTATPATAPEEEKKQVSAPVDALAVARNAVAETERTALSVVNDSIQQSIESAFNSSSIEENLLQYVALSNNNMELMGASTFENYIPLDSTTISTAVSYNPSAEYTATSTNEYATQQISSGTEQGSATYIPDVIENKDEGQQSVNNDNQLASEDKPKQDVLDMVTKEEKKTQQEENNNSTDKESVNKNSQENEAATGGVNLNEMANSTSLDSYMIVSLIDSPFYQTKEIYRNSKPVDNERALKRMNYRNDKLHREMIEQQYNK